MHRTRIAPRLALLLPLAVLPACQAAGSLLGQSPRPTARLGAVSIQDLSLDGLTLAFELEVQNPYDSLLPVAALDYRITQGGRLFLEGDAEFQDGIPARGARTLPLTARVGFAELLQTLQDITPGTILPYEADLGVAVDAPVLGELPVPALPAVSVKNIEWRELSLQKASAVLRLGLGNTNQFPLELARIDYALSLAGAPIASSQLQQALALAPGGEEELELEFTLRPIDLGLSVFNVLTGSSAEYRLTGELAGDSPFGPLSFPLDEQGNAPFL